MDRAFGGDGTSVPSADTMQEAATCLYFPADLRESSEQYKFLIDLPGVPKSDIKVRVISTLSALYCSASFVDVLIVIIASFVLQQLTALLVIALCSVHQGHYPPVRVGLDVTSVSACACQVNNMRLD